MCGEGGVFSVGMLFFLELRLRGFSEMVFSYLSAQFLICDRNFTLGVVFLIEVLFISFLFF